MAGAVIAPSERRPADSVGLPGDVVSAVAASAAEAAGAEHDDAGAPAPSGAGALRSFMSSSSASSTRFFKSSTALNQRCWCRDVSDKIFDRF